MATLEILEYGITFAMALIITLLAVSRDKSEVHFKFMAGVLWFIFAVVHFIQGVKTDPLTYVLSFLWMGFGLIFIVWGWASFFNIKKEKVWGFKD